MNTWVHSICHGQDPLAFYPVIFGVCYHESSQCSCISLSFSAGISTYGQICNGLSLRKPRDCLFDSLIQHNYP